MRQSSLRNKLIASGLVQGDGTFVLVSASTLFSRCAKAFRPFDVNEAKKIARARNEYLHGGAAAFSPIPEQPWWASYRAQAIILVHAQDKSIADLVGTDREPTVEEHLARNRKNIEHRTEMLIARAVQRLDQFKTGNVPARRAAEWNNPSDLRAYLSYSTDETCPACGDQGTLEGDDTLDSPRPHYERVTEDDWSSWMEATVGASYFSCPSCRLVLDGYEFLEAAQLPTEFEVEVEDYVEPDYGND